MNILVLTPDRVGSTLLQKYITVIMQNYDYGKPVINLHELTNGLEKYHSTFYNQEVLGKPHWNTWGYYQSLKEITELLSTDHYKVSRLAQYHLINRQDSLSDQLSFYRYLNDNFYIISARRENLFEHAMSWCIVAFTKRLNHFLHEDKIKFSKQLYEKGITIDQTVFENYLGKYVKYLEWVDAHFTINSVFNYEENLKDLERYVNNLDIFPAGIEPKTWNEMYGISWNDWNKCHYLMSDISGMSSIGMKKETKLLTYDSTIDESKSTALSTTDRNFVEQHRTNYDLVGRKIEKMSLEDRTLVFGIPIKLQTLAEKYMLVKNFEECLVTYNNWSLKNKVGKQYSLEDLGHTAYEEIKNWYTK